MSVSIATLSYWQSGRSVPGRRSTLAALAHLEDVLKVAPGTLTTWVPQAVVSRVDPTQSLESMLGPDSHVPTRLQRLDDRLRNQLALVSEHVVVLVGADRRQRSAWVRRVVQARTDAVDRFLTVSRTEDDPGRRHEVIPLVNCRGGDRHAMQDSRYVVREILLDRVLSQGESLAIEYLHEYGAPYPSDARHELRRRVPIGELTVEVHFDPGSLPARCEAYERRLPAGRVTQLDSHRPTARLAAWAGSRAVTALTPDANGRVQVARRDLDPGRYGVRWAWG